MKRFILRIGVVFLIGVLMIGLLACSSRDTSDVSLRELTMMEIPHDSRVGKNPQLNQLDIINHCRASTGGTNPLAYYIENKKQKLFTGGDYLRYCAFELTEDDLYYQKYKEHTDIECLYVYRDGVHSVLAENSRCFCWDGNRIIYCSLDGDVFALNEEDQPVFLFHDPDRDPKSLYGYYPKILATPEWIVLKNTTNIHVFRTEEQSLNSYADFNPYHGQMFIYENWCILLGCEPKGAEILDLLTGQITPLDLQIELELLPEQINPYNPPSMIRDNTFENSHIAADACVFQDKLILSCFFSIIDAWKVDESKMKWGGTYILDFETKTAEKITDPHYPTLIAAEGRLFGIDLDGKVYDVFPKDE